MDNIVTLERFQVVARDPHLLEKCKCNVLVLNMGDEDGLIHRRVVVYPLLA